jgi:hypothetical protein
MRLLQGMSNFQSPDNTLREIKELAASGKKVINHQESTMRSLIQIFISTTRPFTKGDTEGFHNHRYL